MAKTITVMPNQSIADVIIQSLGSLEAGIQFCRENGISISDVPAAGTVFNIPDSAAAAVTENGILKYLTENQIVLGTLGTDPPAPSSPPLGMHIVLKPSLTVNAISGISVIGGYYAFELLEDTALFIHANPLVSYIGSNNVNYLGENSWLLAASPHLSTELSGNPVTVIHLLYHIPFMGVAEINMMCWWYNTGAPAWAADAGITFEDSAHNSAFYAPLVIIDSGSNTVRAALCADLQVNFVSSTSATCTLKLTRIHSTIATTGPMADFSALLMNWILPAGVTPVATSSPDIILVTVAPGTFTFGVESVYNNPGTGTIWPKSACTQVVEIS
jgi:hypothetical protein